jgi:hypothetical protein
VTQGFRDARHRDSKNRTVLDAKPIRIHHSIGKMSPIEFEQLHELAKLASTHPAVAYTQPPSNPGRFRPPAVRPSGRGPGRPPLELSGNW